VTVTPTSISLVGKNALVPCEQEASQLSSELLINEMVSGDRVVLLGVVQTEAQSNRLANYI
jgi:hypothetical protein